MHAPSSARLPRLSFGVGDRFAHQAAAQLAAFEQLEADGVLVAPVWNKSNREHGFVGSQPPSVRAAAARAVEERGWGHPWFVDADHIRLETVERFLDTSDFFTIDVADSIGHPAPAAEITAFVARHPELTRTLNVAGVAEPLVLTGDIVAAIAGNYLLATREAGAIHRHIKARKGEAGFVTEVSLDETDSPQTPRELLVILCLLADERVPLDTIAPKFTGRFNKGVDYVGDLVAFEREFNDDLAVLAHAASTYGLPVGLKLSVHSGSDKFSLYPVIRRALERSGAGVHVKTAGTTWLEEIIGLSEAGGDGLALTREIYAYALGAIDELCAPYASVIDIDRARLPSAAELASWDGPRLAAAIRHLPADPRFNPHVRQLLHVSFKVAAKQGARYTDLLVAHRDIVGRQVTENLYERHLRPLFAPQRGPVA
ncbi:MAG: tagaturonate epimerase family protein [Planctomycetota bacterium]|nr:tagaturonate epimerase family protein [Planctomycetota bacterium]